MFFYHWIKKKNYQSVIYKVNNYIKWHYKAKAENSFSILSSIWNIYSVIYWNVKTKQKMKKKKKPTKTWKCLSVTSMMKTSKSLPLDSMRTFRLYFFQGWEPSNSYFQVLTQCLLPRSFQFSICTFVCLFIG